MKAVVYTKVGPPEVLQLQEVEKPAPKAHQVLVKVEVASGNALDWRRFASQLGSSQASLVTRVMDSMIMKSVGKVLGADIAGRVEAVGEGVTQFHPGDEVFGVAAGSMGGFAEYACAGENHIALKPANVSFEAAAAAPTAALTALQGLRDKGQVQAGQKVLISGASGGVGTFAVQIAKALGAEVTAVCSPANVDTARSIGADHVIDYTRENFTRSEKNYDLVAAVNGNYSLLDYRKAVRPGGKCIVIGGSVVQIVLIGMLLGPLGSMIGSKKVAFMGIARLNQKDLAHIGQLLESGKVVPVIERRYPLRAAAEGIRYLAEGHARGKVVFMIS